MQTTEALRVGIESEGMCLLRSAVGRYIFVGHGTCESNETKPAEVFEIQLHERAAKITLINGRKPDVIAARAFPQI